MTIVGKDIKNLNLTDDVLIEFLKLNEEDYTLNSNEYVLIDHHDNVVGNILPLVVALDLNKSYVTCERVEVATITYYDKNIIPTIPYKWDNRKAKYINICLELEQVEKYFEFAAWKLYCVLNGINLKNYDKYKWVLERIKRTPDDMPNADMPISRAYEIAQLPKNLIERTYNVNGKSKPIYKMNIKQIKNLKEYV
ncbi:hypothetical protein [Staphylococcus saccharolyticus]|uniref:Uncharacterized protein n=1 Tax=Staphylococcus saccharolyticus TaxID=33028 RepID=A0A380HB15_9STAP|nr:hypothetical protein [Staphylococcus saccharolyticus]MBL7564411.1 hypothetical protein [Staphylococcus saccharolyticus]MBL7571325.1 hypothetical protein [Staphylococcus saccharolyticus]QQB99157.1 hypothetical protein I6I31_04680 [Staphylococcus saccharolyticus]RTX94605.1 hypothetical protein CD145_09155 [Staphylococcus saccharolyticus]TAA99409.1 hypothetical protein DMB72_00385 [Staphylococcus saccharolyticus]